MPPTMRRNEGRESRRVVKVDVDSSDESDTGPAEMAQDAAPRLSQDEVMAAMMKVGDHLVMIVSSL